MTAIFISHSSDDNAAAAEMKACLEAQGHTSLFLDFDPEAGIKGGSGWEQTLYQQLRQCQAVIALLTPSWLASKWCFAELVQARERGKAIFPVKVQPCESRGVFGDIQAIDLTAEPEEGYRRLRIGLLECGLDPQDVFDWDPKRPPYPGLLAFQEADAAIFFGRGEEILTTLETLDALRRQGREAARFALVFGASGSGKSSLARAGVIPRLKKKPAEWLPVPPFRPQQEPLDELAAALAAAFEAHGRPRDWSVIRTDLHGAAAQNPVDGLALLRLARDLAIAARQPETTLLLTIDQAEELFGDSSPEGATRFLRLLRAALEAANQRLMAIATLRSDFLGEFQNHPALQDGEYPHHFRYRAVPVDPMPLRNFPAIIQGPARLAGVKLDDGLVEAMVHDTGARDALPLLAFTLRRLYERYGGDGRLGVDEYESLGRLEGAIREEAQRVIMEADPAPEEIEALHGAFVPTMVRINADGGYARRRARFDDLPPRALPLLRRFVDARLLVTDRDPKDRETIEVAHEALLRTWPLLGGWLAEDQDKLRLLESVQRSAEEWDQGSRRDDLLVHRNGRLKDAEALLTNPRFTLPEASVEWAYLDACSAAQRASEERRIRDAERIAEEQKKAAEAQKKITEKQKTIIRLIGIAFALVLLAAVGVGLQYREAERAQREARVATIIRRVIQAKNEFEIFPTRGLLLAVEALNSSSGRQLPCLTQLTCVQFTAKALVTLLSATGGTPLIGHEDQVVALSFSADGKLLATADGWRVYLWRIDQLRIPFAKLRNPSQISAISFSGDGKLLATAGFGTVHLWRIDQPESPFHIFPPGDLENMGPTSASFSSNTKLVMTASGMGAARVWRLDQLEAPTHIADLTDQSGAIIAASFTSDGKFIATASSGGQIQQWRLDQLGHNQKPVHQADLKARIGVASFSPDGNHLLIPRQLKTEDPQSAAHLVDLNQPETWEDKPTTNVGFKAGLGAAAFSADGKLMATGDDGGAVRVWRVGETSSYAELRGHEGPVYGASFSYDGKFIATAGWDRTARIWRVDQPKAIANHDQWSNWTTHLDELFHLARMTAGRNLTREEWSEFFPDEEYHATFPDLPGPDDAPQAAAIGGKASSAEPASAPTETPGPAVTTPPVIQPQLEKSTAPAPVQQGDPVKPVDAG